MPSPIAAGPRTDNWPAVILGGQTYPFPTETAARRFQRREGGTLKLPVPDLMAALKASLRQPAPDGGEESGPDGP